MPEHTRPRPAPAPAGARPKHFTGHRRDTNCPMSTYEFAADNISWGVLARRGEWSGVRR